MPKVSPVSRDGCKKPLARGFQGEPQDVGHVADQVDLHFLADRLGHVVEVGLVPARQDDLLQAGPVGGKQLLLDATDRQHLTLQRDLAGHAYFAAHRSVRDSRLASAVTMVIPADGPSFGTAPAGTCTWKFFPVKRRAIDAQIGGVRADVGERDPHRLLHDVAELASER